MTIRDGDWRLIDWEPVSGRTVWALFDGEKTVIRTDYPVDNLIQANTEARNATSAGWSGDWHRIASVPLNIYHDQLAEAERQDDQAYVSRWLNSSDNRAWRTKEGTV